ncbi:lactococcin 972 family bacteriocin [Amycolatopsis sp. SID8362]|nr:lactococcin 972 family bacteriocin [Amycolatopsis sp. SID8362]NED49089.1 lactococcin 972 family bacteriocin [Amycolatopsis sp. SID8362]
MGAGLTSVAEAAPAGSSTTASPAQVLACSNVGGGTWCHGTEASGVLKRCYSNYVHNQNYHSATAVMAGATSKRWANAGYWAQAGVVAGWAYTCYAYYNPNA